MTTKFDYCLHHLTKSAVSTKWLMSSLQRVGDKVSPQRLDKAMSNIKRTQSRALAPGKIGHGYNELSPVKKFLRRNLNPREWKASMGREHQRLQVVNSLQGDKNRALARQAAGHVGTYRS